jgi:hypothetical protein
MTKSAAGILFLACAALRAAPSAAPTSPAAPVSPTAAALSPTASVPAFPVEPPSTPQNLRAEFALVTKGAEAARPTVRLAWEASEPGTYVVRGYRLLKRVRGGEFAPVPGPEAADVSAEDYAQIGKAYDYAVLALDAKGNSSAPSAPASLDLTQLPAALLAPRAPTGLTATSARISARLKWEAAAPWLSPVTAYRVYRSGQAVTLTALTAFEDISPTPRTDFIYRVTALDNEGRESAQSLTALARATGALAPSAPGSLTASVKPEKVSLGWEKSDPGTAPVTAYLLTRIAEPGLGETKEQKKSFKPLEPSRNSYSDTVEGDRYYRYELKAADLEGNTSLASALRLWVPAKPFNKTSLLLMPTAYSNFADKDTGFNVNVLFDLYIGELYESYTHPATGATQTGFFQPLQSSGQLGVVSLDLKGSFLAETWLTPAMAVGFYGAALVPFGGLSSQQVAVTSSGGGFQTLGNLYGVMSKRLGSTRAAVHAGAMLGNLSGSLAAAAPADWGPTLRHLTPGGNYPDLFNRFLDPKLGATSLQAAPHMAFAGIQFPLTVPFGFASWKTGLKAEVMAPIFPDLPAGLSENQKSDALSRLPLIWNFHIDNLPLFGFEFSFFQFKGGLEWIAFYHIPDLTWSF